MASFGPCTAYNELRFPGWYFNSPIILIQLAPSLADIYKGNMDLLQIKSWCLRQVNNSS